MTEKEKDNSPQVHAPTVVIAMLGMGKTTACQRDDRLADDDFGDWCRRQGTSALSLTPTMRRHFARRFVREVIMPHLAEGKLVLTNEPAIAMALPLDVAVVTMVPRSDFRKQWYDNVILRTLKTDRIQFVEEGSFLYHFLRNGMEWPDQANWRLPGIPRIQVGSYCQFRSILEGLL